jgi:C-terminal processing protease CtpA/Prc
VAAESGYFYDVAPETDMHQAKTPPDDTAVFKQGTHFFRRGIGGNVEILGMYVKQQITYAPAYQAGSMA